MAAVAESITGLTALTTPAGADLLCIVDDVGGAAEETKKITVTNLFGKIPAQLVCIGDDACANVTTGLVINQGTADDSLLALKSSDVAHGGTALAETDTFGAIGKLLGAGGGLKITGFMDAEGAAYPISLSLRGYSVAAAITTKTAASYGLIDIFAGQISGAAAANVVADGNVLAVRCHRGGGEVTIAIIDEDGELHTDDVIGVGDDWDDWDDLALASDLSRLPKARFHEMMKYQAEDFERAGLLTLSTDEDGTRHAFIRHKAMLQFAMCCFAEVAQRMKRYEHALLSLGVSPKLLEAS